MQSDSVELQELRARVAKLERRNAKWRLWLGIPLLIILLVNMVSNLYSFGLINSTFTTRNFTIKDEQGRTRILMNSSAKGPGIVFLGSDGKVRAGLHATDRGAGLGLHDASGKNHIVFGLNADTSAYFAMNGGAPKASPLFMLSLGESTYMSLRSARDSVLFRVP